MKTTAEILIAAGVSRRTLERLLERRPELRPAATFAGAFAWTDEEAARVVATLVRAPDKANAAG